MSAKTLAVLLADRRIGQVTMNREGRLAFTYDDSYRADDAAITLSLSMPLSGAHHAHERIAPFLWGLLPDNELILDRWARRFHVSARNPFALLSHVGEDCAGAVQFILPEKLAVRDPALTTPIEWLDEAGVAVRLRGLRVDPSAWRGVDDAGQFSLAGAQAKTALLYQDRRWGVPSGRIATTHILKPPIADLDGHAENEHLCLNLARALGLPVVTSKIRWFEDQVAIVVERYDRARTADLAAAAASASASAAADAALLAAEPAAASEQIAAAAARAASSAATAKALATLAASQPVLRLHQEDVCQALAISPMSKYENDGGPGVSAIASFLHTHSSRPRDDIRTLIAAQAFNWLIAGSDGHAKNYSVLHGGRGRVRLAPLYDIASALPYPNLDEHKLKLAMKIGGKYRLDEIGARQWAKLAESLGLDAEEVLSPLREMTHDMPGRVSAARDRMHEEGVTHPILDRLAMAISARAAKCLRGL